jgi:hypothetical protein
MIKLKKNKFYKKSSMNFCMASMNFERIKEKRGGKENVIGVASPHPRLHVLPQEGEDGATLLTT